MIDKLYFNEYNPLTSYWQGGTYQNPANAEIKYDEFGAVELLEKSGWTEINEEGYRVKDGKVLEFSLIYRSALSERSLTIFQEACKRAGIKIELQQLTPASAWKNLREKEFELMSTAWGAMSGGAGLMQARRSSGLTARAYAAPMIWILLGCSSGPLRPIELEASCGSEPDAGVDEADAGEQQEDDAGGDAGEAREEDAGNVDVDAGRAQDAGDGHNESDDAGFADGSDAGETPGRMLEKLRWDGDYGGCPSANCELWIELQPGQLQLMDNNGDEHTFVIPDEDFEFEGDFGDPKLWEAEFWSLRHHLTGTLFDGMYPVFPWMAFLLVGMAVVRIGLDEARSRRRVLVGATLATAATYGAWWAARAFDWGEGAELLTDVDRFAAMPGYLVASAGQAVILLCLALEVAERWPRAPWLPALCATGQLTFSVYIFRIFIGGGDRSGLFDWLGFADGSTRSVLTDGWIRVAIFVPLMVLACHLWAKRFGRGPLEWAMRRYSDR